MLRLRYKLSNNDNKEVEYETRIFKDVIDY